MDVTIDKFGRILISKRIREQLGIKLEQVLELSADEGTLFIKPKASPLPTITYTQSGFPVIQHGELPSDHANVDVVALIKADREEYLNKKLGWS